MRLSRLSRCACDLLHATESPFEEKQESKFSLVSLAGAARRRHGTRVFIYDLAPPAASLHSDTPRRPIFHSPRTLRFDSRQSNSTIGRVQSFMSPADISAAPTANNFCHIMPRRFRSLYCISVISQRHKKWIWAGTLNFVLQDSIPRAAPQN